MRMASCSPAPGDTLMLIAARVFLVLPRTARPGHCLDSDGGKFSGMGAGHRTWRMGLYSQEDSRICNVFMLSFCWNIHPCPGQTSSW